MTSAPKKPLMRSLGEFFGHITRALRTNPNKKIVSKTTEERHESGVTFRRTTIDEIELQRPKKCDQP
jgi:hypothetical protein